MARWSATLVAVCLPNSTPTQLDLDISRRHSRAYQCVNTLLILSTADTCAEQTETDEAAAMFIAEDGAVIKNVILSKAQAEGIHCRGSCTLQNVWWEDVCEDAATFKQAAGKTSYVIGGGAKGASDKVRHQIAESISRK